MSKLTSHLSLPTWLALPFLAIPAMWPLVTTGLQRSSDGVAHLLRLDLLDYHLRHGTLYPRWVPELMFGHGYPLFNFYGPATYYLLEAFHLLGFDYFIAASVALLALLLVAGVGMYLLAEDMFSREQGWASLIAATAYMYAPYVLTNLYIRGDMAEFASQALLPWVFWSVRRLVLSHQPARYLLPVALTLGGLATTHDLTLLFVTPALAGYSVVLWLRAQRQRKQMGWLVAGLLLAMGISAFSWLPVIGERAYLTQDPYEFSRRFLLPDNAWRLANFLSTSLVYKHSFNTPVQLGLVQIALAIAGFLLSKRRDGEWFYLLLVAVFYGLGGSALSLPIWTSSPLLEAVQFPWRLLSILSIPLALFAGGVVLNLRAVRLQMGVAVTLLAVIVVTNRPQLDWMEQLQSATRTLSPAVSAQMELETGARGTTSMAEFTPRWVQDATQLALTSFQPGIEGKVSVQRGNA